MELVKNKKVVKLYKPKNTNAVSLGQQLIEQSREIKAAIVVVKYKTGECCFANTDIKNGDMALLVALANKKVSDLFQ